MSEFDPYLKWLGIRDAQRPLNHYRLLGLDRFERDVEVISMAADRQMSHIRTYQNGPHGDASQKILNELARARRCLLTPEKKQIYDQRLQAAGAGPGQSGKSLPAPNSPPIPITPPQRRPSAGDQALPLDAAGSVAPHSGQPPVTGQPPMAHRPAAEIVPQFENPYGNDDLPDSDVGVNVEGDVDQLRGRRKQTERKQTIITLAAWISGGVSAVVVGAIIINSGILSGNGNYELVENLYEEIDAEATTPSEIPNSGDLAAAATIPSINDANNQPVDLNTSDAPQVERSPVIDAPEISNGTENNPSGSNDSGGSEVPGVNENNNSNSTGKGTELDQYPAADEIARTLITKISLATRNNGTQKVLNVAGIPQPGGRTFSTRLSDGLIIGFDIVLEDGELVNVTPVYLRREGVQPPKTNLRRNQDSRLLIAKPGYAVGQIDVNSRSPVCGTQVTFMKIETDGLDIHDAYVSEWVGANRAVYKPVRNPTGSPIIGIQGTLESSLRVNRLGLVSIDLGRIGTKVAMGEAGSPSTSDSVINPPNIDSEGAATSQRKWYLAYDPESTGPDYVERNLQLRFGTIFLPENYLPENYLPETKKLLPKSPSGKELEDVRAQLMSLYAREMKLARTQYMISRLLTEMTDDAKSTRDGSKEQWIIWGLIIEAASRNGQLQMAFNGINELNRNFQFDTWQLTQEVLEAAAQNASSENADEFRTTLDGILDFKIKNCRFEEADWLLDRAAKIAKSRSDRLAYDQYKLQKKSIQEFIGLSEANDKAVAKLEKSSDDRNANLQHGNYLFVVQDDLESAMKHWAKSKEKLLNRIVEMESQLDLADSDAIVELANEWEVLGEPLRSAMDRKATQRAIELCEIAAPLLSGLEKRKFELKASRLGERLEQ